MGRQTSAVSLLALRRTGCMTSREGKETVGIRKRGDPQSVRADTIHENNRHDGLSVRLNWRIPNVRCALQIDVGYADITPRSEIVVFPALLYELTAGALRVRHGDF